MKKRYAEMSFGEWRRVAEFFLVHAAPFVEDVEGSFGMVQAILGEDGSEGIEGALELSELFHSALKELESNRI